MVMGNIHSHHKMSPVFSSTDVDTVAENATDENFFVSVIVSSTAQEISAKMGYKDQYGHPQIITLDDISLEYDDDVPKAWKEEVEFIEAEKKAEEKRKAALVKKNPTGTSQWNYSQNMQGQKTLFNAMDDQQDEDVLGAQLQALVIREYNAGKMSRLEAFEELEGLGLDLVEISTLLNKGY